jgi:hypothetical protein
LLNFFFFLFIAWCDLRALSHKNPADRQALPALLPGMQIDKWLTKSDVAADCDELQRAKASANVGRLKKSSSRIGRLKEEHVMKLQRSKI